MKKIIPILSILTFFTFPGVVLITYLGIPYADAISIFTLSAHIVYVHYKLHQVVIMSDRVLRNQMSLTDSMQSLTRGKRRTIKNDIIRKN